MDPAPRHPASPAALWQRHATGTQAWIGSGFADETGAKAAAKALKEWLGAYPNQAGDIARLALSSAYTALQAGADGCAGEFAGIAVDSSAFRPLASDDDYSAAALATLILAESHLARGDASGGGMSLEYARAIVDKIDATSALRTWALAQCEIIAAAFAEAVLERREAMTHYTAARDLAEPLVRNAKLRKELSRDWLRVVYGNAQQLLGQEEAADRLVRQLASRHYVRAALGAARNATAGNESEAASLAAAACAELGIPRDVSSIELRGALRHLPDAGRLAALDRLLARFEGDSDLHGKAMTATLFGLRANTASNAAAADDLARSGAAAASAQDAYAWSTYAADSIEYRMRSKEQVDRNIHDIFLLAAHPAEQAVWGTPRHLPFRAHFEPTMEQITFDALKSYTTSPSVESSAHLSACLEARRTPYVKVDAPPSGKAPSRLQRAHLSASDWLGRIVHAIRRRPETLVLIPTSTPEGTTLLCVSNAAQGVVEVHTTSGEFQAAALALARAMARHFEPKQPRTDFAALGGNAYALLPARLQVLLHAKRTLLIAPELSAGQSGVPYELFHGPKTFLGVSHVIARLPSLRAVAAALEPEVVPAARRARAVCVAAPNAVPGQPLRYAKAELDAVHRHLDKAGWTVPALSEMQLGPEVLLDGLELASLVHIAAHGQASGGAHAILLPGRERLVTSAIASRRGQLPAAVYLSACSIGASEYLGGGVSRGFADALAAKGAPAVIASQWPLQDAAAATCAAAFYEASLKDTVGEALRVAREREANTISPALWASLILIGNPWHRLGVGGTSEADAATKLLRIAADASATGTAKQDALATAAAALKRDPRDRRLDAAIAWAMEARGLLGSEGTKLTLDRVEQLANVAHDLGALGGEALCRTAAADLLLAQGREEPARAALDEAIDLSEAISRSDEGWTNVLHGLLAQRQRIDLDFDLPEIRLPSGMTVNDRSSPQVRAVLRLQHAVDQQDTRRGGALHLRLPERSLEDLCWNGVVLGQRNRFPNEFACAGFAAQLAARIAAAGWVKPSAVGDARRIAGGVLRFLWTTQRMTHLEREFASAQAKTLQIALEALSSDEIGGAGETVAAQEAILRLGDQLQATALASPGGRFARAREKLHGRAVGCDAADLGRSVRELIDGAPPASSARAHRTAWGCGFLLELAYELRLKGNSPLGDSILAEYSDVERNAEGKMSNYLVDGFKELRTAPLAPLIGWRSLEPSDSSIGFSKKKIKTRAGSGRAAERRRPGHGPSGRC